MSLQSKINIKIASKSFLLGEYLALAGGPSLVVAHAPYFQFSANKLNSQKEEDSIGTPQASPFFHAQSPAGIFLQNNLPQMSHEGWQFQDPHHGRGGFGASTVQYIAAWLLREMKRNPKIDLSSEKALQCWSEYQNLFPSENKPSGADLLAQFQGGVSCWQKETNELSSLIWPFADLQLDLFKTPYKINTHLHLQDLAQRRLPFSELKEIAIKDIDFFKRQNEEGFLQYSKEYAKLLKELELTCKESVELVDELQKNTSVIHARGCGALGIDVIAVYSRPGSNIQHPQLRKVATLPQDLASGIALEELA